ncbi:beta-barrel assembly-enhancing protease [Aromatoleum aromaticum]|uniref:Peptidase family M48 protein n=1 Tax=Aromatoleum aromaticum (strain DSM 19018 / LMG 30748 / EbN1) TaxID=76114 RepID=Q5NXL3_AROAE|nr:M48 family metalloprotease [Aromatoleum aromaticum]NMG54549.1 M48 family metalloprotease [Aromatoleum aromaticum]CAI10201.1 putative peptidase family M48 protein [Aromatoleum aromaticum EbN1]
MIKRLFILLLCVAMMPRLNAADLPDLGDVAASELSPLAERRIGESIIREIRFRDAAYLDDAEIEDYVDRLGQRLVTASAAPYQEFAFFVIRDATLNAFALPGGFIGVHSGLILAAESESELASVLGHEIAHVTQRHIAQLVGKQSQSSMVMLASLLVAVLAARSNSQISEAAIAAGQAGAIQSQLGYTRDFEREADRLGLQTLEGAGYDVRGMPSFFERLQRASRFYENNAPSYLRTHPLTGERISDMGNRVAQMRYRQVPDSQDFGFVRAKLRVTAAAPLDAVREFQSLAAKPGADAAARYGLARALLAAGRIDEATKALDVVRRDAPASPFIESLAAELRLAARDPAAAVKILEAAQARFPDSRALRYALIDALLQAGRADEAAAMARADALRRTDDDRMWTLVARSEAALGRRTAQHRAQAEVYVLQGSLPAAIEQLDLARRAGDGDFYELSAVDARMRELKAEEHQRRLDRREGN